jgi:hypothetical protein
MARCSNLYLILFCPGFSDYSNRSQGVSNPVSVLSTENSRTFENRDQRITGDLAEKIPFFGLKNLRGDCLTCKAPENPGLSRSVLLTPENQECVAGAGGFEPPHGGIKIRCLTAWRRPNCGHGTGLSPHIRPRGIAAFSRSPMAA